MKPVVKRRIFGIILLIQIFAIPGCFLTVVGFIVSLYRSENVLPYLIKGLIGTLILVFITLVIYYGDRDMYNSQLRELIKAVFEKGLVFAWGGAVLLTIIVGLTLRVIGIAPFD